MGGRGYTMGIRLAVLFHSFPFFSRLIAPKEKPPQIGVSAFICRDFLTILDGRGGGARTHDPLIKSQLLFQLSYASIQGAPASYSGTPRVQVFFARGVCLGHGRFMDRREWKRRLPWLAIVECGDKVFGAAALLWLFGRGRRAAPPGRFGLAQEFSCG